MSTEGFFTCRFLLSDGIWLERSRKIFSAIHYRLHFWFKLFPCSLVFLCLFLSAQVAQKEDVKSIIVRAVYGENEEIEFFDSIELNRAKKVLASQQWQAFDWETSTLEEIEALLTIGWPDTSSGADGGKGALQDLSAKHSLKWFSGSHRNTLIRERVYGFETVLANETEIGKRIELSKQYLENKDFFAFDNIVKSIIFKNHASLSAPKVALIYAALMISQKPPKDTDLSNKMYDYLAYVLHAHFYSEAGEEAFSLLIPLLIEQGYFRDAKKVTKKYLRERKKPKKYWEGLSASSKQDLDEAFLVLVKMELLRERPSKSWIFKLLEAVSKKKVSTS